MKDLRLKRAVSILAAVVILGAASATPAAGKIPVVFCFKDRYCVGVFKKAKSGRIDFRIGSFSFHGRYKLCVTDPAGLRICHRYRLGRFCGCSIKDWKRNFPDAREGQYKVEWRRRGHKLAPAQFFRHPEETGG